jgi:hypothetical protein
VTRPVAVTKIVSVPPAFRPNGYGGPSSFVTERPRDARFLSRSVGAARWECTRHRVTAALLQRHTLNDAPKKERSLLARLRPVRGELRAVQLSTGGLGDGRGWTLGQSPIWPMVSQQSPYNQMITVVANTTAPIAKITRVRKLRWSSHRRMGAHAFCCPIVPDGPSRSSVCRV